MRDSWAKYVTSISVSLVAKSWMQGEISFWTILKKKRRERNHKWTEKIYKYIYIYSYFAGILWASFVSVFATLNLTLGTGSLDSPSTTGSIVSTITSSAHTSLNNYKKKTWKAIKLDIRRVTPAYVNSEKCRHSVKVIGIFGHWENLWQYGHTSPLRPKLFNKIT